MRTCSLLALMLTLLIAPARAQFPPTHTTNLQVLPKDIAIDSLLKVMGGFTRALGVGCAHCHVQREGQTFSEIDFSLDDNPRKTTARVMLRMVAAINEDQLTRIASRRQPEIRVGCPTCHRGVVEPRQLRDVLFNTYLAAGADSTEAVYRDLRERYYGRASYDFGDVPLVELAVSMATRGNLTDAIRFLTLNTEMNPRSTFALRQLGAGHLRGGDTTSAIAAFERALVIDPDDAQFRRLLDALTRKP